MDKYDVLVIGAGHAGCEAALACARLGHSVLLSTINLDKVAHLPCNPSIGGPGKSQLVREIDILGGEMAENADKAAIQYRILNSKKGAAAQALRAQEDLWRYSELMRMTLDSQKNLSLIEGKVISLQKFGYAFSAEFQNGLRVTSKKVIVATGTFLRGKIFIGDFSQEAGRYGEQPSNGLYYSLKKFGIDFLRLKTGTTPRADISSINTDLCEEQPSESPIFKFTHGDYSYPKKTVSCFLTRTTKNAHSIIKKNIHRSPLFGGKISGIGPRYCPSIEDKIIKFPNKDSHLVFVEPEGFRSKEAYLQGLSTSLPEEVQMEFLSKIPGFENIRIFKPGYAVEYDSVNSRDLLLTLEHSRVKGLYFAGQVNGSSGYEEAASQGIIAGINASLSLKNLPPLILNRSESMIGVLIDDLCRKGTKEPYRLFPSSSEFMLYTRQDNADERLASLSKKIGLISDNKFEFYISKKQWLKKSFHFIKNKRISLNSKNKSVYEFLKTPEITLSTLGIDFKDNVPDEFLFSLETSIKYEGYIKKQAINRKLISQISNKPIPSDIKYSEVPGLSMEAASKLENIKPAFFSEIHDTLGISFFDILVLHKYIEKKNIRL